MTPELVGRAFTGVILLFRGRPEGLLLMDRTVEGFWRSFLAVILVLPSDALAQLALVRLGVDATFMQLTAERLPILLLDFAILPVVLAAIVRPLGLSRHYVDFVVARNWGSPVASAAMVIPFVLEGAGWIGPEIRSPLALVLLVLVLRYQWMALRLALRAPVPVAAMLLVADFFISLTLVALFSAG